MHAMLKRIRDLLGIPKKPRRPSGKAAPGGDPAPREPAAKEAPRKTPPRVRRGPNVVHNPIPVSDLDPDAVRILQRLAGFDHTAYLVGGCVRDLLLGRKPKDFDIGTSATPRQVKRLFSNSRIIGRRFRLAHVYFQSGKILEVATFRSYDAEDEGEPGGDLLIREDNVFGSPEEDALRRDFTINALFYDPATGNVLDHADGLGDLRRRLIRTIGDPEVRFREDPIRILRAIKFAARLDFDIEEKTRVAIADHRHEIPRAATARVLEEINRFCRGAAARRSFELCRETGVLEVILPEIAGPYGKNAGAWTLLVALLDAMDARQRGGTDIGTGEIFAALLLPLLAGRVGWSESGRAAPPRDLNSRDLVEEILRPIAVRLRISRKDQERCRLIVQTLLRMVPARAVRRAFRQSIVHRPSFADAMWILEAIAGARGGDFAEALEFWRSGREPLPARPEAGPGAAAPEGTEPARKRRRRRRPRRGKRGAEAGPGHESEPRPEVATQPVPPQQQVRGEARAQRGGERPAPGKKMPAPWDDDYFFAALPSAPPLEGEENDSDRYGASEVATGLPSRPEPAASGEDGGRAAPPRRKRRRRSRRRRPGGAPPPAPPAE